MRTTRRILQILIFVLFLAFLLITVYPVDSKPPNPFTRISPLNTILLWLQGKASYFWLAPLLLLILTAFMGRFFCSTICPLGTTLDIAEKAMGCPDNPKERSDLSRIKYGILAGVILAGVFGFGAVMAADPTTIAYRFYTLDFFPMIQRGWDWLREVLPFLREVRLSYSQVAYRGAAVYGAFVMGIALLGFYHRRFWCRNLCPLGALLSIFGRFSFIQKKVNFNCIHCNKCITGCKMGAIPTEPSYFKAAECIYCFNCVSMCPVNAISFKWENPLGLENLWPGIKSFFLGTPPPVPQTSSGLDRRTFLGGATAGAVIACASAAGFARIHPPANLLRPPGALPEDDFNSTCIRCGECIKGCITCGLQPTFLETGIEGIMTPRLVPSQGHCEYQCNVCQHLCPTGAIQPFEIEEKANVKLGNARIDRNSCIAWYRDEYCLVCDEHCPYKAVYWKMIDNRLRPFVDPQVCVGCGMCENKCPVNPVSAIRVYSQGEKRIKLKSGQRWTQVNPVPLTSNASRHQIKPPAQGSPPGSSPSGSPRDQSIPGYPKNR